MYLIQKYRFLKFLLVGVLNTIFGYGVFALSVYAGMDYRYAVLLSTILGVLFNFKTIGTLVFGSKNNKLIFRFICVYVVIYLLNVEVLRLADSIQVNLEPKVKIMIAGGILVLPLAIVSYVLNKLFVFRG
jgi:putative flippase GtrA